MIYGLGVHKVNVQFLTPFGHASAHRAPDPESIWRRLGPLVARWRKKLQIEFVNAIPCQAGKYFRHAVVDVGKHSREMVFVNASPRNLADYLASRRRRQRACRACESAIACEGVYQFAETPGRIPSRSEGAC
jgi:MoaA/NifB/PqqE/SkfB family radical SAM enzyme